ncbi:MAG: leucine-rich repeat domain-containing protein, partial [Clostridia bacterium]|nr:leucine-rich repeat domain-containing protein [Clostridia bacterium]
MKRTLCLFLALILAVGICFSAPVTITASAAFTLESGTEHTVGAVYIDSTTGVKFKITDIETKQVEVCGYSNLQHYLVIPATVNISENGGGTLAYSVTSIGASAFANCNSLYSVEIPEGVITIGEKAFYLCSYLSYVKIPESVTSIGTAAFVISPTAKVKVPCKWEENPLYDFSGYYDLTVTIADHAYKDGVCETCGYECPGHTYEFAICTNCSYVCHHETVTNGVCEVCGGTYCGKTESDTVVYFYNESTKTLTI